MNDVASTSLVTVRRPPTMLPYAFKQSLEDLARAGRLRVEHVAGDQAVVEPLEASEVPLAHVERVEVPHGAVREESRAVDSSDQAFTNEPADAGQRIAMADEVDDPKGADTDRGDLGEAVPHGEKRRDACASAAEGSGGHPTSFRPPSKPVHPASRARKRAKKERGSLAADAQAGAPSLTDHPARKVRSPGPRASTSVDRRVVMRAPRKRSEPSRHRKERFVMPEIRLADVERVGRGYIVHVALPSAEAVLAFVKTLRGAR